MAHWNEQFLDTGKKGKGRKQADLGAKKAVLLSGSPGIGKTTSAKVVCQMLGFQAVEVMCLTGLTTRTFRMVKNGYVILI